MTDDQIKQFESQAAVTTPLGQSGTPDEIAHRWLDRGPKLIIVTGGAKGATAYTKSHRVTDTDSTVRVVFP